MATERSRAPSGPITCPLSSRVMRDLFAASAVKNAPDRASVNSCFWKESRESSHRSSCKRCRSALKCASSIFSGCVKNCASLPLKAASRSSSTALATFTKATRGASALASASATGGGDDRVGSAGGGDLARRTRLKPRGRVGSDSGVAGVAAAVGEYGRDVLGVPLAGGIGDTCVASLGDTSARSSTLGNTWAAGLGSVVAADSKAFAGCALID
mmetsp:Transcript_23132/g.54787  ORF Transcript_23132/g.54787 Transcript_23132/m.54787 type:complete len:214 (+) Transcript_23132:1154-1795(+)